MRSRSTRGCSMRGCSMRSRSMRGYSLRSYTHLYTFVFAQVESSIAAGSDFKKSNF